MLYLLFCCHRRNHYILKFQISVSLCNSLFSFIINHLAKFCVSCKFFHNVITFTSALFGGCAEKWRAYNQFLHIQAQKAPESRWE